MGLQERSGPTGSESTREMRDGVYYSKGLWGDELRLQGIEALWHKNRSVGMEKSYWGRGETADRVGLWRQGHGHWKR